MFEDRGPETHRVDNSEGPGDAQDGGSAPDPAGLQSAEEPRPQQHPEGTKRLTQDSAHHTLPPREPS
jgi:hypothetical protein